MKVFYFESNRKLSRSKERVSVRDWERVSRRNVAFENWPGSIVWFHPKEFFARSPPNRYSIHCELDCHTNQCTRILSHSFAPPITKTETTPNAMTRFQLICLFLGFHCFIKMYNMCKRFSIFFCYFLLLLLFALLFVTNRIFHIEMSFLYHHFTSCEFRFLLSWRVFFSRRFSSLFYRSLSLRCACVSMCQLFRLLFNRTISYVVWENEIQRSFWIILSLDFCCVFIFLFFLYFSLSQRK